MGHAGNLVIIFLSILPSGRAVLCDCAERVQNNKAAKVAARAETSQVFIFTRTPPTIIRDLHGNATHRGCRRIWGGSGPIVSKWNDRARGSEESEPTTRDVYAEPSSSSSERRRGWRWV